LAATCAFYGRAATWHVDSAGGDDAADGTSPATAWRTLDRVNRATIAPGDRVLFRRGGLWRGTLRPASGAPGKPVVYSWYGTGPKPILQNSSDRSRPEDWFEESPGLWSTRMGPAEMLPLDVGIFICDHGKRWGVKKWRNPEWKMQELANPLDYWYDPDKKRVLVRFERNPGEAFSSIELAFTRHVVEQGGRHDVTYDGLWVRYGAAHGFGGGSTRNITIRNCDISWIGGGLQFWRRNEATGAIVYPVRFGNGIEFWGNAASNLVERNRLWEIYDAALTNQGRDDTETDIVWRDNVIWNAEYSFEYWNAKLTANVTFEHNTCVDAGGGWAHAQRPDRNGAHLMYYHNRAATTNFVVRNNIFCRATEWTCRSGLDWRYGLAHDGNLVWNEGSVPVIRWLEGKGRQLLGWDGYRALGFDPHGAFAKPVFVNEAARDYRLAEGSSGRTLATDGGPVGARDMPGLDGDQSLTSGK
ncbi:MAG: right-handed parallel beta-helix repeat-containing protein, partial [Kiritimatiellae bacterium]|nr:right-handed parallel beta-helix repeat-containing protein [Kiritimatiellia bacterium]